MTMIKASRLGGHILRNFANIRCPFLSKRCSSTTYPIQQSNVLLLNDPFCNIPATIAAKVGRNLHRQKQHPLGILQHCIIQYWGHNFKAFDDLSPIVTTQQNFDMLRIPLDHVSRNPTDTYYLNPTKVLRTHTSAHQIDLLQSGLDQFLVSGDVYRRDEIDRSHYPVFHQVEGVKIFPPSRVDCNSTLKEKEDKIATIEKDLKEGLEGLARHLFGPHIEMRWVDAYFPFTEPSFELEVAFQGQWLEVLGCGVIHPDIMSNAGRVGEQGWAFGLGLERLAMVLFKIPDIRLFWTDDLRFHEQFTTGNIVHFQPYSKYPTCYKDMSFWIDTHFHMNNLNEIIREVASDLVEQVQLVDEFSHPITGRRSHCYRISYRSMDRNLTNDEIDNLQENVRNLVVDRLGVELR